MPRHPVHYKDKSKGLECPRCGCRHFDTAYTKARDWGIRRGKTCRNCGSSVMTREVVETK